MTGATQTCPDCKLVLPAGSGEGHAYLGASPACWALFETLLAREYADPAYFAAHRVTVDAYAAQHPGRSEPRTIQSINLHLVGLYLTLHCGLDGAFTRRVLARLSHDKARLTWLAPPADLSALTVADALQARTAPDHAAAVSAWGRAVWTAWAPHHATVIALAERARAQA